MKDVKFSVKMPEINVVGQLDVCDINFEPEIHVDGRKVEGEEHRKWMRWFWKPIEDLVERMGL